MAQIFISYSGIDRKITDALIKELLIHEHTIAESSLELGSRIGNRIFNSADVYIILITSDAVNYSKRFYNEMIELRNYVAYSRDKLLIPIFIGDVDLKQLPESVISIKGIHVSNDKPDTIREIAIKIDEAIHSFLGRALAKEQENEVIKDNIKNSAPIYIQATLKELTTRENRFRIYALFWYILGFVALLLGVFALVWMSNNGLADFNGQEIWSKTVFYGIKSLMIIVLLIATSKYSFNLGKSYMNESLKVSDRIHAISFGKFYLQVFEQRLNPDELKDIFRDWNISNQSSFANLKSSEYDPKLLESLTNLVNKLKSSDNEK